MRKSQINIRSLVKVVIICVCSWCFGFMATVWWFGLHRADDWKEPIIIERQWVPRFHVKTKYGSYLAGYMAQRHQDYKRTTMYYGRALERDPDNESLQVSLYLLKAVQGRFDENIPPIETILALKRPELLADYVMMAQAIRAATPDAYQTARKILDEKPYYGLDEALKPALEAWLLAGEGKTAEARQMLQKLANEEQIKPFHIYYKGLLALYLGDEQAADEAFRELGRLPAYPSLTAPIFIRDFYQKQHRWQAGEPAFDVFEEKVKTQDAVRDILNGLKEVPDLTPEVGMAIVFYDMSVSLGAIQALEASLIFNELALYLVPEATVPKIWGAELLESVRAYPAANQMYDKIKNPSDIILFKKSVNLMLSEAHHRALPILEDVGARNPHNPLVQKLLAEAYARSGEKEKAVTVYRHVVMLLQQADKQEELGAALFALGAAYDETGKKQEAERVFLDVLKFQPNDPLALNYLGYLWLEQGKNKDEAFEMVKKAHEIAPEDPFIMDSLALGYYYKGDYERALELAERSADMIPYSAVVYDHLGDIYAALGRTQEALYQYQKALEQATDMTDSLKTELIRKIELYAP